MFHDLSTFADHVQATLVAAEADLRLDQAVYGLDTRDEKQLQQLLADGLAAHHAVAREAHYPSTAGRKLTHRPRCDLVLTPLGRPLKLDAGPPSLFDPADPCPPGEALWIEVKVAYQFREGQVRHGGYGTQWRQAVVADLRKMEADPLVRSAALLLVVFTESAAVVAKDVELFEDVLVRQEVVAGFRQVRPVPIQDRIGHHLCTAAIWPTVQR